MKKFPDRKLKAVPNWVDPHDPSSEDCVMVDRFEQEKDAYAHLMHYGVCDKGVVP